MKLNIGCGDKTMDGYVNVDLCGRPDVVCDLSVFPWPFEDNTAEEIYSSHFLEHVQDFDRTVLEIHRILKPSGLLHFRVPHFRSPFAIWHLHLWQFSVYTCEALCTPMPYLWKGKQLFVRESIRINFVYGMRFITKPLEWFANLYPLLWDCLGLPIQEVEFIGRKR